MNASIIPKQTIIDFMAAYWNHFHFGQPAKQYETFMRVLHEASDDAYSTLEQWHSQGKLSTGFRFNSASSEKLLNAIGTLQSEFKHNGVSGLQQLIEKWNTQKPTPLKKPKRENPLRWRTFDHHPDYREREQDSDYEPREFL